MACNCKNTVTSFLGGDVPNPTTFLNCGEADGTYNNPLETGKTQCVAEDNVLRILDDYKISGTVKNSGQIVFERTFTGDTDSWEEWNNDGTYFRPIKQTDTKLSASTLNTSSNIVAGGSITTGTHDGSDILYVNRFSAAYPYGHIYAGNADNNTAVGLRFVNRNALGVQNEAFSLLGTDNKATFQGNLVISGASTVVNTLSATGVNVGNGNGTISANTFTAPSITIGQESGVITGTTVAAKYSGASISNSSGNIEVDMTTATFRPGTLVEVDTAAANDMVINLPEVDTFVNGKYTFLFTSDPHASSTLTLNSVNGGALEGMVFCLNGQEWINSMTTVTFTAGKSYAGTRIEVIATNLDRIMIYIWTPADKGDVAYS